MKVAVIARSEATKQSSAREARRLRSAASAEPQRFSCAPAGARLDCFASLAMTKFERTDQLETRVH
jgi:hypothetical protein